MPCQRRIEISELNERFVEVLAKRIATTMRKKMGWRDVHEELQNLPYCELQETITKVYDCYKCNSCKIPGLCVSCWENEMKYHILVDREEVNDLAEKGLVKGWMDPRQPSEIEEQYREAVKRQREITEARNNLRQIAREHRKRVHLEKINYFLKLGYLQYLYMADSFKTQERRDMAERKSEPGVAVIECDEEEGFRLHCCCLPCFEKVVQHKTLFFRPGNVDLLEKNSPDV